MLNAADYTAEDVEEAFLAACNTNAVKDVETRAHMTQVICFWHRMPETTRDEICSRLEVFLEPLYLKRRVAGLTTGHGRDQLQDIVTNWEFASSADKRMVYAAIGHTYPA